MKQKKYFSTLFLMILFIVCSINAQAFESVRDSDTYNVLLEGKVQTASVEPLTLILKDDSGNIGYVDQSSVDVSGEYRFKFKLSDLKKYTAYVKAGNEDVTSSVISTEAVKMKCVAKTDSRILSDSKDIEISGYIDNQYDNAGVCKLITAFYSEEDLFISASVKDISYSFDGGKFSVNETMPDGASYAKSYLWSNLTNMIPLAGVARTREAKNLVLIGTSLTASWGSDKVNMGWGQCLQQYCKDELSVKNMAHSGWSTLTYMASDEVSQNTWSSNGGGWEYVKTFLKDGDFLLINHLQNDWGIKGYKDKYYETVADENGRTYKKYYYTNDAMLTKYHPEQVFEQKTDSEGTYITIGEEKVYLTSLTYANSEGVTYSSIEFEENMRIILDYCGKNKITAILSNYDSLFNEDRYGGDVNNYFDLYKMQNSDVIKKLSNEYGVLKINLYEATHEKQLEVLNAASDAAEDHKDYFDENGNRYGYIRIDYKLQTLAEKYYRTINAYKSAYDTAELKGTIDKDNHSWYYTAPDSRKWREDTIHYNIEGANMVAKCAASLLKDSGTLISDYIK